MNGNQDDQIYVIIILVFKVPKYSLKPVQFPLLTEIPWTNNDPQHYIIYKIKLHIMHIKLIVFEIVVR